MSQWIIQSDTGRVLTASGTFSEDKSEAEIFERYIHATKRMDERDLWRVANLVELNDWEPEATRLKNKDKDDRQNTKRL